MLTYKSNVPVTCSVAVMTKAYPQVERQDLILLQEISSYLLLGCGLIYIICVRLFNMELWFLDQIFVLPHCIYWLMWVLYREYYVSNFWNNEGKRRKFQENKLLRILRWENIPFGKS